MENSAELIDRKTTKRLVINHQKVGVYLKAFEENEIDTIIAFGNKIPKAVTFLEILRERHPCEYDIEIGRDSIKGCFLLITIK
jgi:DNA-binding protein